MKKLYIINLILSITVYLLNAQNPGFFLDDWEPKSADIPNYDLVEKSTIEPTISITIDMADKNKKVSKYIYGNNAVAYGGGMTENQPLVKNIQNLSPNVLRWPGGNLSNEYFWNKSANDKPDDIPSSLSNPWFGKNVGDWQLSTDQYYDLLELTNCTGIICVNYSYARYGTSDNPVAKAAHMAAEWVRYDNGRSKFWEIGNENYGNWQAGYQIDVSQNKDDQPETITGALYGKHCSVFIDSMRAAATETGVDIKIGVVAYEAEDSYDPVQTEWNEGMMPEVGDKADFLVVHSYFTPYAENSSVSTILNSHDVPKEMLEAVSADMTEAKLPMIPIALTEWNIFAEGSMQMVSYINGMLAALVLGELVTNDYGFAARWDLINGWSNGNDHGMFSTGGEPGVDEYNPRAVFYYMYYFQKYFGDYLVHSEVDGNSDIITYASSYSSGESGIVIINKGNDEETALIEINNFNPGKKYYYYVLTGGDDNGDFSRRVFVNEQGPPGEGGGPNNYETLKAYSSEIESGIKVDIPPLSVIYLLVEDKLAPQYIYSKVDTNNQIISVEFTDKLVIQNNSQGFNVTLNETQNVTINDINLHSEDSSILILHLNEQINKDDEIKILYSEGNITSTDSIELISFPDTIVDNLLPGSIPRILSIGTSTNGDQINILMNKEIIISDTSINNFELFVKEKDTTRLIEITNLCLNDTNNKSLDITPGELLFAEYEMFISYTGNDIYSVDSGYVNIFDSLRVVNYAPGLPPIIDTAKIINYGFEIVLVFNKEMIDVSAFADLFVLKINDEVILINNIVSESNVITISLTNNILFSDTITLSYNGTNVTSKDRGILKSFNDRIITNNLEEPEIFDIPGNVDAELFSINNGMEVETCTDEGGGNNLGYIDPGDWIEYEIDVAEEGEYTVKTRIAAESIVGQIILQTRNTDIVNLDTISIPVTGGWQTWMTIYTTVNLDTGRQSLRLTAITPGYNINWLEFKKGNTIPRVSISEANTNAAGNAIELTFEKEIGWLNNVNLNDFTVKIGNDEINILELETGNENKLILILESNISMGDENITVSYSGNTLTAMDYSIVNTFEEVAVENQVIASIKCNNISVNSVNIYPNPIKNQLIILSENKVFTEATIYDLKGRLVYKTDINNIIGQPLKINLSLDAGTYIITLESNSGLHRQLIIAE